MVSITKQINDMVEQLQEPEQVLVFEIVRRFLSDDIATQDDLKAITAAREEYRRGETVSLNDINWN